MSPEEALWYTTLIDGLAGALRGNLDDVNWVADDSEASIPRVGSFNWCCDQLGFSPRSIRLWFSKNYDHLYYDIRTQLSREVLNYMR